MPDASTSTPAPPPTQPMTSPSSRDLVPFAPSLPQSLVLSRLAASPTLLPPHLAQLVTALSLCARVSIRASALFLEAALESLQVGTVTGLGLTRRALIAAVGSARALHYVKEGLDWSGRDEDGKKSDDAFLQVLDKWTNLGVYMIHHTFTLAELFTMSGFYLTLNTLQTGFSAAEESVRLLDSILGSNESSRALSSIITLIRSELTRKDPRHRQAGGLLSDQDPDEEEKSGSAISNLTALTKALTAFACLQTATHRRTLRTLKLRVVYDCTVVAEGSASSSPSDEPAPAEVTPEYPGKYGGPSAPPRFQPHLAPDAFQAHKRAKSTSALSFTSTASLPGRRSREPSARPPGAGELLTDVRSELEARAAAIAAERSLPGSPARSRRESVVFDFGGGSGGEVSGSSPTSIFSAEAKDYLSAAEAGPEIRLCPTDLLDDATEEEIVQELEELVGTPMPSSRPRSIVSLQALHGDEGYEGDEEEQEQLEGQDGEGQLPAEVEAALKEIEARYGRSSSSNSLRSTSTTSIPSTVRPIRPGPTTGQSRYSYEVEIETTTTTRTTVRAVESHSSSVPAQQRALMPGTLFPTDDSDYEETDEREVDEEEEWVELATVVSPGAETARDDLPSSPNGGAARRKKRSVASLSRVETIEHPEESRQRLQVVLSTMTKKFTQRKRTVRRISPAPPASSGRTSRAASYSPAPSPGPSLGIKRRWPVSRRSSVSTSASTSSSSNTVRPTSPTPPPPPEKKGKASVLKAAVSKAFRQRNQQRGYSSGSATEGEGGWATALSEAPTPMLSPTEEAPAALAEEAAAPDTSFLASFATPSASPPASIAPSSRSIRSPPSLHNLASGPFNAPKPPSTEPALRRAASVQTLRSTLTTTCTHAPRSASEEREPKSGNYPHRHLVENLQRFARYSSAAYGQSFLRILGIGKHEFKFPHTQIHANNHAFAHHVGIRVEDILLSSFTDPQPSFATEKMSPIVNYVAVDHSISAIVLSCRGSLGLSDILVDLTCSYEPIPMQDADPGGAYYVHAGMFASATTLQRGTVHDVIKEALEQFPGYGLVLTGHSLGGGVASLLSILWSSPASAFERQRSQIERDKGGRVAHPPITTPFVTSFSSGLPPGRPISCYTYGVPCVASSDLVAYCRGLVTSTVHSYDIVPTLSLGVLRDLKSMAMSFYAEQGTCEEIVGRVIGLCQRRFMAKRAAKKNASASSPSSSSAGSPDLSRATSPTLSPAMDDSTPTLPTDPSDESRLVPLSADELTAGRGSNLALAPNYRDPSLVGSDDLVADDVELSNWLWSLKTTIRASSDNEKLYPPGDVFVVENFTVFVAGESAAGNYTRREGRRVLLRAVDDVERRFSEPVFSRTMLSDHSPVHYEACCDLLASAVL
ncbi:hypothetical protein JCM10207_000286 [Rhodosporidiobolus poonsookiae]